jgi:hypothetical protein
MVVLDWRYRTRFLRDGKVVAQYGRIAEVDLERKVVRVLDLSTYVPLERDPDDYEDTYDAIEVLKPEFDRYRNFALPDDAWMPFEGDPTNDEPVVLSTYLPR